MKEETNVHIAWCRGPSLREEGSGDKHIQDSYSSNVNLGKAY